MAICKMIIKNGVNNLLLFHTNCVKVSNISKIRKGLKVRL